MAWPESEVLGATSFVKVGQALSSSSGSSIMSNSTAGGGSCDISDHENSPSTASGGAAAGWVRNEDKVILSSDGEHELSDGEASPLQTLYSAAPTVAAPFGGGGKDMVVQTSLNGSAIVEDDVEHDHGDHDAGAARETGRQPVA